MKYIKTYKIFESVELIDRDDIEDILLPLKDMIDKKPRSEMSGVFYIPNFLSFLSLIPCISEISLIDSIAFLFSQVAIRDPLNKPM